MRAGGGGTEELEGGREGALTSTTRQRVFPGGTACGYCGSAAEAGGACAVGERDGKVGHIKSLGVDGIAGVVTRSNALDTCSGGVWRAAIQMFALRAFWHMVV
jgi:hypothetical protein